MLLIADLFFFNFWTSTMFLDLQFLENFRSCGPCLKRLEKSRLFLFLSSNLQDFISSSWTLSKISLWAKVFLVMLSKVQNIYFVHDLFLLISVVFWWRKIILLSVPVGVTGFKFRKKKKKLSDWTFCSWIIQSWLSKVKMLLVVPKHVKLASFVNVMPRSVTMVPENKELGKSIPDALIL